MNIFQLVQTDPKKAKTIIHQKFNLVRNELRKQNLLQPPNTFISLQYLFRDLMISGVFIYLFKYLYFLADESYLLMLFLSSLINGTCWFSFWVLGHECGHNAFLPNKFWNHLIGYILHSSLLVPYFSWQFTHAKHHRYTNHLVKGETHIAYTKKEIQNKYSLIMNYIGEDAFFFLRTLISLLIGWPLYLCFNSSGGKTQYDLQTPKTSSGKSHFFPSQIFPDKMNYYIYISSLGVLLTIFNLFYLYSIGIDILYYYIGPWCVVNIWLVIYTSLHHTSPSIPHYGENIHNFELGALSTIDQNYPKFINWLHHDIGSSHLVHHMFSFIPHYNAIKATKITKKILGNLYYINDKYILSSLWEIPQKCRYVESNQDQQQFK